ncbi:hypothetical protein EMPS_10784 [Entomortierella parvispora]|uniref:FAD-binding domain-containing protein n=1 Tax=Entomortierella parvispora TaxID=205924 RepID=A0A9P3HKU2_9FUNG|nr:hypothetical protein EMPS_10784 [Entomortierella parvispora]
MYRRQLHQFLLDEVPRDKISMGKKIVAVEQDEERVVIQCSDGLSHEGSILVGADGAYSGVRSSMHALLQREGKLSASDAAPLKVHHRSILGTTGPLDKAKFPGAHDKVAYTGIFIGKNSTHTWRYFSVVGNRIAWRIDTQLDMAQSDEAESRTVSEWDSEFQPDADLWRKYRTNLGGSMGDLIDLTDPETISKVMLEQKLFDTWSGVIEVGVW